LFTIAAKQWKLNKVKFCKSVAFGQNGCHRGNVGTSPAPPGFENLTIAHRHRSLKNAAILKA
jgi:hypothetical protein